MRGFFGRLAGLFSGRRWLPVKVWHSPIAWTFLYFASLATWTCTHPLPTARSAENDLGQGTPDRSSIASTGGKKSSPVSHPPGSASTAAGFPASKHMTNYTGPRLRRPPADEGELGLDIAIEDRDGQSLGSFHKALEKAAQGKGQARVLFYGASHVASDMFTGYVRTELQREFGDGGHGFVMPARPWKGYRHEGIRIENSKKGWESFRVRAGTTEVSRYGLAGVYLVASKAGTFGMVSNSSKYEFGQKADHFEVMYLKQPGGGRLSISLDGKLLGNLSTRSDTFEAGYFSHDREDGPYALKVTAQGDGPVHVFGTVLERSVPGAIVDTVGINGSRARYHLLWEDLLYREHLKRRNPDLIVLAYGTNESGDDSPIEEYENQLRSVLRRVKEVLPHASCLLIGPSDRPVEVSGNLARSRRGRGRKRRAPKNLKFEDRPRTHLVNETQYHVALEHGCGFFDIVAFQGGALSMVEWVRHDPPFGAPDYIHFTRRGYKRLGKVLFDALLERYRGPRKVSAPGIPQSP